MALVGDLLLSNLRTKFFVGIGLGFFSFAHLSLAAQPPRQPPRNCLVLAAAGDEGQPGARSGRRRPKRQEMTLEKIAEFYTSILAEALSKGFINTVAMRELVAQDNPLELRRIETSVQLVLREAFEDVAEAAARSGFPDDVLHPMLKLALRKSLGDEIAAENVLKDELEQTKNLFPPIIFETNRNLFLGNALAVTNQGDIILAATGLLRPGGRPAVEIGKASLFNQLGPTGRFGMGPDDAIHDNANKQFLISLPSGNIGSVAEDGTLKKGRPRRFGFLPRPLGMAVAPDGRFAVTAGLAAIPLWNPLTLAPTRWLRGHANPTSAVAFSHDSKLVASGSQKLSLSGLPAAILGKFLSLKGRWQNGIRIWNVDEQGPPKLIKGNFSSMRSLAFSIDNKTLVGVDSKGTIRRWDVASGNLITEHESTFKPNMAPLKPISFPRQQNAWVSPNGKYVIGIAKWLGGFKNLRQWQGSELVVINAVTGNELFHESNNVTGYSSIGFSPDGQQLVIWDGQGKIIVRNLDAWVEQAF